MRIFLIGLAPLLLIARLFAFYLATPDFQSPTWDPLLHALDNIRVYNSWTHGYLLSLLKHISFQVWWFPAPTILTQPFYLFFGPSFLASVACNLFLFFFLMLLPAFFLKPINLVTYFLFVLLCGYSPHMNAFSLQVMYELTGAFLTLACFLCYMQIQNKKIVPLFCALLSLLLFTKWNYGLQFLLFFIWSEREKIDWKKFKCITNPKNKPVLSVILGLLFGVILYIRILGGFELSLFGKTVLAHRIDNPAYIFFILFCLRAFLIAKDHKLFQKLNNLHQKVFVYSILPFLCWLAFPIPNRFQAVLTLTDAVTRGSRFGLENLSWFFVAFYRSYNLSIIAVAITVLGCVFHFFFQKKDKKIQQFVLFYLVTFILLVVMPEHRIYVTVIPIIFLMAALGWQAALNKIKAPVWITIPLLGLLAFHLEIEFQEQLTPNLVRQSTIFDSQHMEEVEGLWKNINNDRHVTTLGISDGPLDILCAESQWFLNKNYPVFSQIPNVNFCDYGFGSSPLSYVKENISNLKWLYIFSKKENLGDWEKRLKEVGVNLPAKTFERYIEGPDAFVRAYEVGQSTFGTER